VDFLEKNLPGILKNKCFNYENLPFQKEVEKTEIGHLFEHMVLENLCRERVVRGEKNSVFNGSTKWNWKKENRGTFHITIDIGFSEKKILKNALSNTISLMDKLMDNLNNINLTDGYYLSRPPHRTEYKRLFLS